MPEPPALELTAIGGPTVLVRIGGLSLIFDPTFDPAGSTYASGPVTLRKTHGPALTPEQVGPVDAVLLSHDQHADNLDHLGRAMVGRTPLLLTTVDGAARLGRPEAGLQPGDSRILETPSAGRLRVTATPARHGPFGSCALTGPVIGFLLTHEDSGRDLLYATGDTVWYHGIEEFAHDHQPKIVLAFAGAAMTRGPFHLTMTTNEVAELAGSMPKSLILPVHCDSWAHFCQSEDDLRRTFAALGMADRLGRLVPGVPLRVD